jgi:transposase
VHWLQQEEGFKMSKTVLANVDGWTPCIDSITQELGIMVSVVFGRVWRYCQGERGVCNASLEKIATELNVSYNTVRTHINTLVEHGYLADLTPTLRNHPHTYADTGKAGLVLSITAAPQKLRSDSSSEFEECAPQNLAMKKEVKKVIKKEEGASAAPTFELFGDDPQPTQQPKRKQAGSARPRDPLLSHPAITAYREVTRRQVPAAWRERVADTVGDSPQRVERWRRLLDDWCGSGWNAGNVKGMLERFNTAQPGRSNNGGAPRVTLSALGFRGPED